MDDAIKLNLLPTSSPLHMNPPPKPMAVTPGPPQWRSLEFGVYYLIQLILWPALYYKSWALSQRTAPISIFARFGLILFLYVASHPVAERIQHLVSPAWLGHINASTDNSDRQYAGFRQQLPILLIASVTYLCLSWFIRHLQKSRRDLWLIFSVSFSVLFLLVAHGFHFLKISTLLILNYQIAFLLGRSVWNPVLTWIFNISLLFLMDWYNGFSYFNINMYGGLMRWNVTFNFCILRFISFNLDYYWAHKVTQVHNVDKRRTQFPHTLDTYSFLHYVAYVLYIPLYFAGPIMTFNSWAWHVGNPKLDPNYVTKYLVRLACAVLLMEVMMHSFHVVALVHTPGWFSTLLPSEIASVGFINLKFIWLKLLIIWRFFRSWALADGLDPPENMLRCMTNNYSTLDFWRDWHASFNLWNVRYLYVPMGGSRYKMINIWVIFTFVAIWHDIQLQLLSWGWLICLFIVPEVFAKWVFRNHTHTYWYRPLAALGCVFNILMMVSANLVGFVLGPQGMWQVWTSVTQVSFTGMGFIVCTLLLGYSLAQVQFEIRDNEARTMHAKSNHIRNLSKGSFSKSCDGEDLALIDVQVHNQKGGGLRKGRAASSINHLGNNSN